MSTPHKSRGHRHDVNESAIAHSITNGTTSQYHTKHENIIIIIIHNNKWTSHKNFKTQKIPKNSPSHSNSNSQLQCLFFNCHSTYYAFD